MKDLTKMREVVIGDLDFYRSMLTTVGLPAPVKEALDRSVNTALDLLNMIDNLLAEAQQKDTVNTLGRVDAPVIYTTLSTQDN